MAKETAIKEELTKDVKTKDTKGAKDANATPVKAAVTNQNETRHLPLPRLTDRTAAGRLGCC